ncbi:MAG: translation elongation factor 4 [Actinobacteria bacterium]|nr:translation elongation factor 4 [Actinomycetota bacterium]MCL6087917.1 translation elongation factor 4 [Actinomycetota bacterium]
MNNQKYIRNFSIIAHIDHGKSTLADRILEYTHTVSPREMFDQYLDDMELERERGITIKAHYVTILYKSKNDGRQYQFNLIDTPGHVDFTYEVSRSLAACEGALLVVDATQGVQAQTLANVYLAIDNNLELIPVINKIDLKSARPEEVSDELNKILGIEKSKIHRVSAKTGQGVEEVLESIIKEIPAPAGDENAPLQVLIFDSKYDPYRGVVSLIKVINGKISKGMKIKFMQENYVTEVEEIGIMAPGMILKNELSTGEVGYIVSGIKEVDKIIVGDTITSFVNPAKKSLHGYKKPKPMVYCGLYPIDGDDYENLREALKKLQLNDSSLIFTPEVSVALGSGFRMGFLGLLHLEIVKERLEREYGLRLLTTTPNVAYRITKTNGEVIFLKSPADYPEEEKILTIEEPYVAATIITPKEYIGEIMKLSNQKRGVYKDMQYISTERVELKYEFPLSEIIVDFFNLLKSISSGFASLDYEFLEYCRSELVKLDILVGGNKVDELAVIVHKDKAYFLGREFARKLKQEIPRHMFEIPVQASIGKRIIARETISAYRKDVTAKLYGGDVTRKNKLLDKQKKGKRKMKKIGKVEIPDEAFMSFYKIELEKK